MDVEASGALRNKAHPFTPDNKLVWVGCLWDGVYSHYPIEYGLQPYGHHLQAIRKLFEKARLVVGANVKYDLHWLRRYIPELRVDRVWDTQLAEFILSAQMVSYPALADTLVKYGLPDKADTIKLEYWDKGIDTDQVPESVLLERNQLDCELTYEVFKRQHGLLQGNQRVLFDLHCDDLLVLQEMEFNGLKYDVDESLRLGQQVETEIKTVTEELNALVGRSDLNWNSGHHISSVLYGGQVYLPVRERTERQLKDGTTKVGERWGVTRLDFPRLVEPLEGSENKATKGMDDGELERQNAERIRGSKPPLVRVYQTNEDVLRSIRGNKTVDRLIALILKISELEKLRGTYYLGIPQLIQSQGWEDSRIHGQINQCVARTGRTSSSKPNLQNFAGELKTLFAAIQEVLLNFDAKALEWVAAVYLSGDEIGIAEIESGSDIHSSNQAAFGLPTRLVAKTFVFRLLYGGSAYAYATDPDFTHVSRSERWWQGIIDKFYAKYKGIAKWHESLMTEVGRSGKLTMPTGREYIFLNKRNKRGESVLPRTQILNYPVQGLGADLMAIVRVSLRRRMVKAGCAASLVCTVHDSVLIDALEKDVDKISNIVYKVFEDVPMNFQKLFGVPFYLPLNVEIQTGPTWGDMTDYKRA